MGAAFWLDRRPPHGLMAAGTLVLTMGLIVLNVRGGLGLAAVGMFLLFGAGGAFTGSLVF